MPDLYFWNGTRLAGAIAAYINTQLSTTVLPARLIVQYYVPSNRSKLYDVLSIKSREMLDADALGW